MIEPIDFDVFGRTVEAMFTLDELRSKLAEGRPLRIKYGVDVTAPFLHIGHAVNLWLMRYLQERGHKVLFLIGDFTTRIGDPTGKSQARKEISPNEIESNAQAFIHQVGAVLLTTPDVFEVRRNSEWFEPMPLQRFLSLLSMVTHAKLIQRDMFQKRLQAGGEIHMHELLYPILQGYDSVMLESDLTIVGSDQLFNELMGRFYQERLGQKPQVVMTTKITPGTDGAEKQSKSLGNYIALADTPRDKLGKSMSIPDRLIVQYMEVYTDMPMGEVRRIERAMAEERINPMEAKKRLAEALVARYHGAAIARAETEWFAKAFSKRVVPGEIPTVHIESGATVVAALQLCLPGESRSALRRLVAQCAVELNGVRLSQSDEPLAARTGDVLKVGKKNWFRISIMEGETQ